MKIRHTCGLLPVLLLFTLLVPYPAQADTALEWTEVDKPGLEGNIIVTPSEVSEIAVGRNGVLYTIDSENSRVYRSLNAGLSWEDISSALSHAGAELPASKIAVAPDNEGIVVVVTDSGSAVYISLDGGMSWDDTNMPALTGDIQALAISARYTEGGKLRREIAVGMAAWSDNVTGGQLWVLKGGSMWASWRNQELVIDPDHIGGEVSAIAYSPDYDDDRTILVVASTSSDDVDDAYKNKTYLCLGERNLDAGTTLWDSFESYPVEIVAAGDGIDVVSIKSSLALPSDYSSEDESSRRLFVSYDREPDAGDDVYLIKDDAPYRLNANGGNAINIASIAYHGTMDSGTLLAGDAYPVAGTLTVQVRRTENPFDSPPEWHKASVPPTGPGNAIVSWSPDGKIAYCGTSKPPGVVLDEPDESALSAASLEGDKWRQMGLMDTVFQLADIAVAPDSKSLFMTTYSAFGPEGIWRSAGSPLGKHWERLLAIDTSAGVVILRLSANYNDDHTLYAAEVGGKQIAVSHNRGNSWQWRHAPGRIVDLAVEDEDTIYVALPGGEVAKSTDGGWRWKESVETTLADINMLAVVDEETMLIGGRNGDVAYSTDGGESFTQVREVIGSGSGDVQVIADANYPENGIIYAATNLSDEGLWRWTMGVSGEWEQLDEDITELAEGQRISGLAVGSEGTFYALRLEPASDTTGGMTRWLYPSCPTCMDFEYDFINFSLPQGAAFNSTAVFPNTLPYLKLSGDAEQNDLWTVDTASQTIYRFQDTLCKFGPKLDAPADGAVLSWPCPCERPPTLILEWEELEDVTEYEVAMYLDADSVSEVWTAHSDYDGLIAMGGDDPVPLSSGSAYYWKARADKPIKSPWSEMRSFALALIEVSGLYPTPGATGVPVRPVFTWDSAGQSTGYEFVLARDSQFSDVLVSMTEADALTSTSWVCDRDLDYSTTYLWKVRASSVTSYSEWVTGAFTTEAAPIALPPSQSSPLPSLPEPIPAIPFYLPIIIGFGVTLVIVLLVLVVRTGR